jgi:hypothetical protein
MSVAERIQPFNTAAHKGDTFAVAGQSDPEMLSYARQEIARLRQTADHDHLSRTRCSALERLVALWLKSD